jgi:hypothetical protein
MVHEIVKMGKKNFMMVEHIIHIVSIEIHLEKKALNISFIEFQQKNIQKKLNGKIGINK